MSSLWSVSEGMSVIELYIFGISLSSADLPFFNRAIMSQCYAIEVTERQITHCQKTQQPENRRDGVKGFGVRSEYLWVESSP